MLVEFLGRSFTVNLSNQLLEESLLGFKVCMSCFLLNNCSECCEINLMAQGLLKFFNADLGAHTS
jgi:hypothetical protein